MALPQGKIFTVRPITSWIDKLARDHGSPGGHVINTLAFPDPEITYQKRDLVLKTMQDSYTEVILPFSTDKALLEEYINVGGTLRYVACTRSMNHFKKTPTGCPPKKKGGGVGNV